MGKLLNTIGTGGALVASFFLSTPNIVWGTTGLIASSSVLIYYLNGRWETAEPNEWLLLIENGKLSKCGVGLKCFVWPSQTVVKFPSAI